MKKLVQILSHTLFILPAVINTLIILWLFIYPWMDQPQKIQIPWQMILVLVLFWGSGILLARGKWYGGIPAAAVPAYIYMESLSGYAGAGHIDWLPIAAATAVYYVLCGVLAHHLSRKND